MIRDMMHRLEDRFPSHVILWPVMVQGDGAAAQIAAAVRGFSVMPVDGPVARPDLVIVARGGGSIEDLWAFNEEVVVRAVAECSIPVISAVGHETDTTLCDFAADRRAPTPTAAAEMAVPVRLDLAQQIGQADLRLTGALRRFVERASERLLAQARLLPKLADIVGNRQQRADDLGDRLRRGLERRADLSKMAFAGISGRIAPAMLRRRLAMSAERLQSVRLPTALVERQMAERRSKLSGLDRLLNSLHPEAPLGRGFARVTTADGKTTICKTGDAISAGKVLINFADGPVAANIEGGKSLKSAPVSKIAPPAAQPSLFGEGES